MGTRVTYIFDFLSLGHFVWLEERKENCLQFYIKVFELTFMIGERDRPGFILWLVAI